MKKRLCALMLAVTLTLCCLPALAMQRTVVTGYATPVEEESGLTTTLFQCAARRTYKYILIGDINTRAYSGVAIGTSPLYPRFIPGSLNLPVTKLEDASGWAYDMAGLSICVRYEGGSFSVARALTLRLDGMGRLLCGETDTDTLSLDEKFVHDK